ncbi:phosphonate ABC transporter ATP-binding protein [Bacillus sp. Marseille-P3661]|uniref:phosphonate ABC transporter ATP-binding protein n=1 Tax=Bacillus sp. Marseille-P3661 TaxID=1936234 RepID=UPI000C831E1E|nr:phosphonate ABC transporter ATP-binding protein [Bacillus sp. Marseille-P3661]
MKSSLQQLTLNNIEKFYGESKALSSLSLFIQKGEKIALIGPSGAGKSTLLNILATIIKPDHGELLIDGIPAKQFKAGKRLSRKIGIIRQQFDLVPSLPVIHNVLAGRLGEWGFFKSMLSFFIPQDKQLAVSALERVGLADKLYEKTANLSGGQQQRVALARLLVQHPGIILADEPVSSLDPARADDIISILVSLVEEENQTLITSLHSVDLAIKYFDRIIALREGKVFFDLPTKEVSEQMLTDLYYLTELNDDAEKSSSP